MRPPGAARKSSAASAVRIRDLLAFVSLAAVYVPAQDATRTDPLRALRRS